MKKLIIVLLLLANSAYAINGQQVVESGTATSGHCAQFTADNLVVDSGGSCGGGGASIGGAVTSGTNNSVLFVNPAGTLAQDNAGFNYAIGTHSLNLNNAYIQPTNSQNPLYVAGLAGGSTTTTVYINPIWNASGSSPTGVVINGTGTTGAATKLLDLQFGGSSVGSVDKFGNTTYVGNITSTSSNITS